MKKAIFAAVISLIAISLLPAVPGMSLQYGGGVQVSSDYHCCVLQESTDLLRFYRLYPAGNGFGIESFYVNLLAETYAPNIIYDYQHPVPLPQDGGYPVFILAAGFQGRVYFLQKNDLHLFITVIDEDMQAYTVVTNNPTLSFVTDPLDERTFCFLDPDRMLISSQGGIYLLDLQEATCIYQTNFPGSVGNIAIDRLDGERVIMSSWIYDWSEENSILLNCQDWSTHQVYYGGWATEPISGDFGNGTYLAWQRQYTFDFVDLVRTLLMRVNADDSVDLFPLYYGGSTGGFNYTPKHTFEAVQMLGDNRFLAICTDFNMIPLNQRLGIFQVQGNSVVYDPLFAELHELNSPSRIYKIQDGYYLSYHNSGPYALRARLLDMETETTSLPDSNVIISPVNLLSTGDNAFYAVTSGNKVHVYRLVEPSSAEQETQVPPASLTLAASPNPFRERLSLAVSSKQPGRISVSVYDLRGRLVRKLETQAAGNGIAELEWDGRDGSGSRLGSGIYLLKAEQGGRSVVSKVIRLD